MPKFEALQSLRAIAASLVVLNHAAGVAAGHGLTREPLNFGANFIGSQGVAIFFILSGFLMTYTADTPDGTTSPGSRAMHFATRRIARVVPLYWFFTLLVAAVAAIAGMTRFLGTTPIHLLKSLFFIPYLNGQAFMLPVLPIGWTLNYEMFFYLIFTAILLLPHRGRILVLFATLAAFVFTGSFFFPILAGGIPHSLGEFLTNPIVLLFGLGAGLGSLRLRYPALTFRVPGILWAIPLIALNTFVAITLHQAQTPLRWTALFWLVDFGIVAFCAFGKPLSLPWLETLGDASYSLYLVHILPLFACFALWKHFNYAAPLLFIAGALLLSAITAYAVYRWLERPLTRAALRLLTRSQPKDIGHEVAPTPLIPIEL
jgi:exopolysaccharide production protein ExoZ